MPPSNQKPHIFVSYSHRDAALKKEFDTNLNVMQLQGIIDHWTDAEIQPGDRWNEEIAEAMEKSQIILFLVSNNFLASNYIRNVESPKAMRMMDEGRAVVVPILLRDTPGWKREDWHILQALPQENKPITHRSWLDTQEAFTAVEKGLCEMIDLLPDKLKKQAERWGKTHRSEGKEEPICTMAASSNPVLTGKTPPKANPESRSLIGSVIAVCAVGIAVAGALLFKRAGEDDSSPTSKLSVFVPKIYPATEPFENSLGMRFVTLPGTDVLCSIWELRLGDFKTFNKADDHEVTEKMKTFEWISDSNKYDWGYNGRTWKNPGFEQSDDHPVVGVTLNDAKKFCEWLTKKERAEKTLPAGYEYRLIRDEEWSLAVGDTLYPWNPYTTPPSRRGNYGGLHFASDKTMWPDNTENHANTTPVGSFDANGLGIFDLGGNVFELTETYFTEKFNTAAYLKRNKLEETYPNDVTTRGSGYNGNIPDSALSMQRFPAATNLASPLFGFRIVLAPINSVIKKSEEWTTITSFDIDGKPVAGGSLAITGKPGGSSVGFNLFAGREFKDFEAEMRFRATDISKKELDFGVAFEFREGTNARDGYLVFVNGGTGTWGRGYWNTTKSKDEWESYPFNKIEKGRVMLDGSLNSMRVVVRGNKFWLYSNDCLLGSKEFDSIPNPGPLKLLTQLSAAEPTEKVTIEFDSVKVRDLH